MFFVDNTAPAVLPSQLPAWPYAGVPFQAVALPTRMMPPPLPILGGGMSAVPLPPPVQDLPPSACQLPQYQTHLPIQQPVRHGTPSEPTTTSSHHVPRHLTPPQTRGTPGPKRGSLKPAQAAAKRGIDIERYKTQLCKTFRKTGQCPYFDRCMFAHGARELRTAEQNAQLVAAVDAHDTA